MSTLKAAAADSNVTAANIGGADRPAARHLQVLKVSAVLGAAALFGTFALAPQSIPNAVAFEGQSAGLAARTQSLTITGSADPALPIATAEAAEAPSEQVAPPEAELSLNDFIFRGVVNWGGYRFTYYSQQVLPGGGLNIPGRHVNAGGYVSDGEGYIVMAGSAPKGTVYDTPFGYQAKIYDRGTVGNHLDVYIR